MPSALHDGRADFDFLFGRWRVHNRRLLRRLERCEPGRLFPPVAGGFADGRGTFFGDDVHDGRAVRVRYEWKDITPASARWEQAYSSDDGETWKTNWVMGLTRTESA